MIVSIPHLSPLAGTKVDSLVADILGLLHSNDEEKAIVFSQWKDMFTLLSSAFSQNKIKFEVCVKKSDFGIAGPLQRFKRDPSVHALAFLLFLLSCILSFLSPLNAIIFFCTGTRARTPPLPWVTWYHSH